MLSVSWCGPASCSRAEMTTRGRRLAGGSQPQSPASQGGAASAKTEGGPSSRSRPAPQLVVTATGLAPSTNRTPTRFGSTTGRRPQVAGARDRPTGRLRSGAAAADYRDYSHRRQSVTIRASRTSRPPFVCAGSRLRGNRWPAAAARSESPLGEIRMRPCSRRTADGRSERLCSLPRAGHSSKTSAPCTCARMVSSSCGAAGRGASRQPSRDHSRRPALYLGRLCPGPCDRSRAGDGRDRATQPDVDVIKPAKPGRGSIRAPRGPGGRHAGFCDAPDVGGGRSCALARLGVAG